MSIDGEVGQADTLSFHGTWCLPDGSLQLARGDDAGKQTQSKSSAQRNGKEIIMVTRDRKELAEVMRELVWSYGHKYGQYDDPYVDVPDEELPDISERSTEGETALMLAAYSLGPREVQILIDHGADLNAKSDLDFQQTALAFAYQAGKLDVVATLLAAGADPTITDIGGLLPDNWMNNAKKLRIP
jgi:ankyrin repeat protein